MQQPLSLPLKYSLAQGVAIPCQEWQEDVWSQEILGFKHVGEANVMLSHG